MNKADDILERLKGQQPVISDPDALTDRIMSSLEPQPQIQIKARTVHLWRRLSIAASILLIIGVGTTLMLKDNLEQKPQPVVAKTEYKTKNNTSGRTASTLSSDCQYAPVGLPVRSRRTKPNSVEKDQKAVNDAIEETHETASLPESDPNLHYASSELTKDTVPYQDPARVDEFIAKLAEYNKVKEGVLTCSATADSSVVSSVYVFPDTKEIDVFGRLLQVACCYKNETPGYFLNFSHQQFFFELKDMRHQLQYRWIAERVNGMILLYGTHAPLGTKESSACYQEYRDELMHINSINTKTKKI